MEPTSPTPRKPSERDLLDYLRASGDAEGCSSQTKEQLRAGTGISFSTLAVAVNALQGTGLLVVERSAGARPNVYCVTPSDEPSDSTLRHPPTPSESYPPEPSDSVPVDAPVREPAAASRPGGSPPPTPSPVESGSPDPAGLTRVGEPAPALEPSDSNRPIGSLAVATAMEAARAAGRSIEPALRARIGNAAQQLAKDESVERILAGARRLGEGGYADLYTAVRAVERGAFTPALVAATQVAVDSKLADVIRLVRATWPRAQIDVAVWEVELEKIPPRYLLDAVRELAKAGGEFAPHWGQVYKAAWRIGVAETERRRSAEERHRLRELVTSIEEGRA